MRNVIKNKGKKKSLGLFGKEGKRSTEKIWKMRKISQRAKTSWKLKAPRVVLAVFLWIVIKVMENSAKTKKSAPFFSSGKPFSARQSKKVYLMFHNFYNASTSFLSFSAYAAPAEFFPFPFLSEFIFGCKSRLAFNLASTNPPSQQFINSFDKYLFFVLFLVIYKPLKYTSLPDETHYNYK